MTIKFGENQDVNVSNRINSQHLTIRTDLIYTDGANVGIGTSSPSQKLDVAGNIKLSGTLLLGALKTSGTSGQLLVSKGSDSPPEWETITAGIDLSLLYNNELLKKNGANNSVVGADIITSTTFEGTLIRQKTIFIGNQPQSTEILSSIYSINDNGSYYMTFSPKESGMPHEKLTLLESSQHILVGIGVVGPPLEKLHVTGGNFRIDNNTTQQIRFYDLTTPPTETGTIKVDYNEGGADMLFLTRPDSATEPTGKMIIDKNGNVGIGVSTPAYKLDVNGKIRGSNLMTEGYLELNPDGGLTYNAQLLHDKNIGSTKPDKVKMYLRNHPYWVLEDGTDTVNGGDNTRKMIIDAPLEVTGTIRGSNLMTEGYLELNPDGGLTYNAQLLHDKNIGSTKPDKVKMYLRNHPYWVLEDGTDTVNGGDNTRKMIIDAPLEVTGTIRGQSGTIHKIHILPFPAAETASSTTFVDIVFKEFFKTAGTNLYGEINMSYEISGSGGDTFESRLTFINFDQVNLDYFVVTGESYIQYYDGSGGGGTRSSSLTDCVVYTNGEGVELEQALRILLQIRRVSGNDNVICEQGVFKVTEIWT